MRERRLAAISPDSCFKIAAGRHSHKELLTLDPSFNDIDIGVTRIVYIGSTFEWQLCRTQLFKIFGAGRAYACPLTD